ARSVGEETDIVSKEMYTWQESGSTVSEVLLRKWFNQHQNEFDSFEFNPRLPDSRTEVDLIAHKGNQVTIVEAKHRANLNTIGQILNLGDWWYLKHAENPPPQLILVTASGSSPENLLRDYKGINVSEEETASIFRLKLEEIEGDFEPRQSLTLRPENTAGVVRAYIEHKLWERGLNKLFYMGPQFRRERPQKGRYRQFYQIGAEVIGPPTAGSESPARDAEVIELLATFLDRLGIDNWNLQLNSVGCVNDRPLFNEALRKALQPVAPQMCVDCQRRAITNPLRVFDCKVPEDQPIIEKLPRISDFLDEGCRTHFEEVQQILSSVGVPFTVNDRLVRGLDYYTRTAFEFTHGSLGAQNAILGGGRYDGLSESLGGPKAPGIGFAIGEDRLVMSLKQSAESVLRKPDVYIAPLGEGMNRESARLARELRREDIVVELGDETFRLKKSFEAATKLGAKFTLIVGENELKAESFALKNLATGEQVSVPRAELAKRIRTSS
ncbi:MAG TPA: histidine--tRNA ligase, partial [Terriglobales bacterium]|nr:histidine--tRNA ligase [Terriglobales bacterium]